jgi:hypothetical protein
VSSLSRRPQSTGAAARRLGDYATHFGAFIIVNDIHIYDTQFTPVVSTPQARHAARSFDRHRASHAKDTAALTIQMCRSFTVARLE